MTNASAPPAAKTPASTPPRRRSTGSRASHAPGERRAGSGAELVDAVEERICGAGSVESGARAEGAAIAGLRAANRLIHGAPDTQTSQGPVSSAPWLHHRVRSADGDAAGGWFELIPGEGQEVVDHCLIGHLLAERIGRPGVCTLDDRTARELHVAELPSRTAIGAVLGQGRPAAAPDDPTVAQILDAATEAFAKASRHLERHRAPVVTHDTDGATRILVASGAAGERAMEWAEAFRQNGDECGVVLVSLVRPFPEEKVAAALEGAEHVVVLEEAAAEGVPPLLAGVRGILGRSVQGIDPRTEDATDRLAEALAVGSMASPPVSSGPCVAIGVAPASRWSERLLLSLAERLAGLAPIRLARPHAGDLRVSSVVVGRGRPAPDRDLDVLLLADPALIDEGGPLRAVRDGGTVLVIDPTHAPEGASVPLSESQRGLLENGHLQLRWVRSDTLAVTSERGSGDQAAAVEGALLAAAATPLREVLGEEKDPVAAVADIASEPAAAALHRGATALHGINGQHPRSAASAGDLRPRLPEQPETWPDSTRLAAVRKFYLTGEGGDPVGAYPLQPATLRGLVAAEPVWRHYPLLLSEQGARPFARVLSEAIEATGHADDVVATHAPRLVRAVARELAEGGAGSELRPVLEAARTRFTSEFELSEAAARDLEAQLGEVLAALPEGGSLVDLDARTVLRLHSTLLAANRDRRVDVFVREAQTLARKLTDLLDLDRARGPEGASPEALSSSLGSGSDSLVDPSALSRVLPAHRGGTRMSEERRERITHARDALKAYVETRPEPVVISPGLMPAELDLGNARIVEHPRSLAVAAGLFDARVAQMTEVVRATRLARLELDGAYEPERHGLMLARLTWHAFEDHELAILPPVTVLETAERARGPQLAELSELLLSGRPVQVLLLDPVQGETDGSGSPIAHHPGIGYLAMAHREAFVLQSTLGRPDQLADGLVRMSSSALPAVAVLSVPAWDAVVPPWLQLLSAHAGRANPCFVYDPAAGDTWAERFDLEGNPDPNAPWPTTNVQYVDAEGNERSEPEPHTFAHARALDSAHRRAFWVLPPNAWSEDQVPLADYLEAAAEGHSPGIPYLRVVEPDGTLSRAIVSSREAFACRDRARLWRTLRELAGSDNEHVRRALDAARATADERVEQVREELAAEHANEVERVRAEAAGEVVQKLVDVLMDLDSVPVSQPAPQTATAPASTAAPGAPASAPAAPQPASEPEGSTATAGASPAPEEEDEEDVSFDDPYIDSPLCTTCNECTNINGAMFKYNADKQAYIADAKAGTFEELVKAAESCPASCIHPGAPRDDDPTATPDLVARAAKFA